MQDLGDTSLQERPHLLFPLCRGGKGTWKFSRELDQLMILVGRREWGLRGLSQRPQAVVLRLGKRIPPPHPSGSISTSQKDINLLLT